MRFAASWAPPGRKDARTAFAVPTWRQGKPYADTWDVHRAVRDGMGKVIWVFRAVHTIADAQARLPVVARSGNADTGAVVADHPLSVLLNTKPNPYESAYTFRYRLSCQVLLNRKGAYIEIQRDRTGRPVALFLSPPHMTAPVPDPRRFVSGYVIDLSAIGEGLTTLKPEQISWVKLPHPTDPYDGMTPLEAAGISVDIDFLARMYNRTFLQNDGRPGGIVGVKGEMDDDTQSELTDRWNRGVGGAGRVSVIEADGLDFVDTAVTPRDAQHVETQGLTKAAILGAFGVPESIAAGNASSRTFSNAEAERAIFWDPGMLGHCALLADGFEYFDDDPNIRMGYDFSGVESLQAAENARRTSALDEYRAGARTLDSYLAETGREPLGTPEARSYWLPMGVVPSMTEGAPAPVIDVTRRLRSASAEPAMEIKSATLTMTSGPELGGSDDLFAPQRKAAAATLDAGERRLYEAARALFASQQERALARLRSVKARKGTRHWDYGADYNPDLAKKELDPSKVYDQSSGRAETEAALLPVVTLVLASAGTAAIDDLGPPPPPPSMTVVPSTPPEPQLVASFNVHDPAVSDELAARANRLRGVSDTTWEQIRAELVAGDAAGESIDELAKRIERVFAHAKGYRARLIARTEVVSAHNAGSMFGAMQSGVVARKRWLSAKDDRVRSAHRAADGQTVDVDASFSVGGESLRYPGDPRGSAANVVACRCTTVSIRAAEQT